MKHLSTVLLTTYLALAALSTSAQLPSWVPPSGLVGWYPFSGNTQDSSGNGYNAVNGGAVLTTDRFGSPNAAYSFNGSSHMVAQFNGIINPKRYTITAWFKTSADSLAGVAALRPANIYPSWYGLTTKNSVVYGNHMTTTAYNQVGASFTKNRWMFAAITFDSLMVRFYVDSVIRDSMTLSEPIQAISNPELTIGTWTTGMTLTHHFFTGSIDEVGVWSRALSYTEVKHLYYNSLTIPTPTGISATSYLQRITVTNPVADKLIVHAESLEQAGQYVIIDLSGKVVISGTLVPGTNEVSMIQLSPGIYIFRVKDEALRIVKE